MNRHFMSFWIFTVTGDEQELEKRFQEKKWPIFQRTRHRQELKKGDQVIVYHGGYHGSKSFVGTFTISSDISLTGPQQYSLDFSKTNLWKTPVGIYDILDNLGFVGRKDNWGIYFQGGVSRIPENDYKKILEASQSK